MIGPHQRPPAVQASGGWEGFRALRVRNYRLYWLGQLVSLTGSWMQTTAQAWLVLQLTRSPFAIGLVATFQFLPVMLLSLFGGVIADRVPRHRAIVVTQAGALVVAAVFGALVGSGLVQLWHVYLLALLQGVITAIDTPIRQAFAVELVGKEDRASAVGLNSVVFNGSRIIGPALAGLLIGPLGIAALLYANAASYLAVIAGLLRMDRSRFVEQPRAPEGRVREQLREALAYVWRTPEVLLALLLVAAIGTFGYNFSVTLPLIGGFLLNTDAAGYGVLGAALGAGSLAAAVLNTYLARASRRRMVIAAAAFSLVLGAVALSTSYWLTLALLFLLGLAGISFTTAANTLIQLRVPDALRGRVSSLYFLLFAGSTPLGGLLIGAAAGTLGVGPALLLCAGLCLAGVAGSLRFGGAAPARTAEHAAD